MSKFKLIEGAFTVSEARELILALLEYKINFHSRESFGSEIRKGHTDERSLKRRQELIATRSAFLEEIKAMDPGAKIMITADIILT
ncbi:hypothetical protein HYN59_15955 [Flavobacterium album]|uniref:Uncharacterized protein n=1 Tax=Flavobacterium album TaxID=2175091 RepID=A0A2S1R1G0_9FLAO|nr:hypothetical protein [Flavobacterium album]AWH86510.1 hypothetical protein HYN59_15955 [Flavobacterium album]